MPDLFTFSDPNFCLLLAFLLVVVLFPISWVVACWYLGRAKKQDERRFAERVR